MNRHLCLSCILEFGVNWGIHLLVSTHFTPGSRHSHHQFLPLLFPLIFLNPGFPPNIPGSCPHSHTPARLMFSITGKFKTKLSCKYNLLWTCTKYMCTLDKGIHGTQNWFLDTYKCVQLNYGRNIKCEWLIYTCTTNIWLMEIETRLMLEVNILYF